MATKKKNATFEDIIAATKPRKHVARICVRGDLVAEKEKLEAELQEAQTNDYLSNSKSKAPTIARKLDKLAKEADKHTYEFTFEAIGMKRWQDMIADHPPTKEQKKKAKDDEQYLEFNPETFPIAAISASCKDPEMDEDQVRELFETWNYSQWNKLLEACLQANLGDDAVGKSPVASAILRASDVKSKQASKQESQEASSLAE